MDSRDPFFPKAGKPRAAAAIVLALAALTAAIYARTGEFGFVGFDDGGYVAANPRVLRGLTAENVLWAFRTFEFANWHPFAWLSHMADVSLFGADAGWHHRVNAAIHFANAAILFMLLRAMTGATWRSGFAAALFAVHPLNVETVAWISERKSLLCMLFSLLAMGAWLRYGRRGGIRNYLAAALLLSLALMSKPAAVTLPFVLVLLDFWPLGRTRFLPPEAGPAPPGRPVQVARLFVEKIPLFALSALACAATLLAQSEGRAVAGLEHYPAASRAANAAVSYVAYLAKAGWPANLSVFYPHPASIRETIPAWRIAAALSLLSLLSWGAFRERGRRPWLLFGWLWYLGTLVPMIGLVQVGGQAMADRYAYLPLVGIFVAVAWGVPSLVPESARHRPVLAVVAGAVLLAASVASWHQAGRWRDDETLARHAVAVTANCWSGWNGLAISLIRQGRYEEAIPCLEEALRIKPDFAEALFNLGTARLKLGRHVAAIEAFDETLRLDPRFLFAWVNRGVALEYLGDLAGALACYDQALRIDATDPDVRKNMANAYRKAGMPKEAAAVAAGARDTRP
jgi:tetratricopeptide (TPR) repeat protein